MTPVPLTTPEQTQKESHDAIETAPMPQSIPVLLDGTAQICTDAILWEFVDEGL